MAITVEEYPTEAEWLEARQGTIGASEAAAAIGESKWDSPLQLWSRKTGRAPEKQATLQMRAGHALEPLIATLYEEETGRKTRDPGPFTIVRNTDYPWLHATLDRDILPAQDGQGLGVLEEKAPGLHMMDLWDGVVPLEVQVQFQVQLLVSARMWGSIAALIGNSEFRYQDTEKHEAACMRILEGTERFHRLVQKDDFPPAGVNDSEMLGLLFPRHEEGKVMTLPGEALAVDETRQQMMARRKEADDAVKALDSLLKEWMRDAERGELPDGSGAYTWKAHKVKEHVVKERIDRPIRRVKS